MQPSIILSMVMLAACLSSERSSPPARELARQSPSGQELVTLSYCKIMRERDSYLGIKVRLTGTWQFGFEQTFLSQQECPDQPVVWLELGDEKDWCPGTNEKWNLPGPSDKTAQVTVVGRLLGPGRYGHLGDYPFKFRVTCLEKIRVTSGEEQ